MPALALQNLHTHKPLLEKPHKGRILHIEVQTVAGHTFAFCM